MEDLPGEVRVDAEVIVEHLRSLVEALPGAYPRTWLPQATFDELQIRADREPIHLNPALHHLHHRWNMDDTRPLPSAGRFDVRARLRRKASAFIYRLFEQYHREEQDFRAATAQSIDAVAYRIDEVATADLRGLLDLVRQDLLDLARVVEERLELEAPATPGTDPGEASLHEKDPGASR